MAPEEEIEKLKAELSNAERALLIEETLHRHASQLAEETYRELMRVRLRHNDFNP